MADQRPGRILLLGDPAARPPGLERALARAGHRLADAADLTADNLEAAPPDLVLIVRNGADWALSELLEQLAVRPGWQQVPRLVLVADPAPVAVAAALRAGADDAAGPAAPLEEVLARIGAALRRLHGAPDVPAPIESGDPFPGGLTPAHFGARLTEEVARATRYSLSFAVIQAELAGFETWARRPENGFAERRAAEAADVLCSVLRVPDFATRTGRAIFAIALPETDRDGASAWIGRWRLALDLRLGAQGQPIVVHAGISTLPQPLAPNATELLTSAGVDLDRARRVGQGD